MAQKAGVAGLGKGRGREGNSLGAQEAGAQVSMSSDPGPRSTARGVRQRAEVLCRGSGQLLKLRPTFPLDTNQHTRGREGVDP